MLRRAMRGLACGLMLELMGCSYAVRERVDSTVCDLAARPVDVTSPPPKTTPSAMDHLQLPADWPSRTPQASHEPQTAPPNATAEITLASREIQQERGPDLKPTQQPPRQRLEVDPELPGADAPPIQLPPLDETNRAQRDAAIDQLFPPLPPLGPDVPQAPGPQGRPLTLSDLQRLATANSPLIRQAASDVEAAHGAAIQAGTYPNPTVGYESDTVGTGDTAGFQGGFIDQTIKTAGKLKLAQAAALMDLENAKLTLRRTQTDVSGQVRAGYFAVLAARESVRINRALVRFTDEIYRVQVDQVKGAQAAPYEPLQLRALAVQARGSLAQARNRYSSAWRQLAATLGLLGMAPTELEGRIDVPIPLIDHDAALARVISSHTDIQISRNTEQKARYLLRLAQVTPVPDVDVRVAVQKDYSVAPFSTTHSIQVGVPLPIWDRNKGNIIQAEGALVRATEELHRVRDDLATRLADAFERYETNRTLLAQFRDQILPDQVRAYRGVYERHQQQPDVVGFADVVAAQQALVTTITTYLSTLAAQWAAVVDIATLLQSDDLHTIGEDQPVAPAQGWDNLLSLPCSHPCNPLADPARKPEAGSNPQHE